MTTDTHTPTTDELTLDAAFGLLRDPRRRTLVSILADREPPVALTDLAVAVAARELETDADEVPSEAAESVAATLHHDHLPRLADGDLVTYDPAEQTVTDARVEAVTPFSTLGGSDAN